MDEKNKRKTFSLEQRNALVIKYLWCIDSVIRQNYILLQAAHLDRDDVYQSLAVRLIRALELYKPGAKGLKSYIFMHLKYELLNCKSARTRYGIHNAPDDLRGAVVSMEALAETDPQWENRICVVD